MPCFTIRNLVDHFPDAKVLTPTDQKVLFSLSTETLPKHKLQQLYIKSHHQQTTLFVNDSPLLTLQESETEASRQLKVFLEKQLEQARSVQGNLVMFNGIGVLIQGDSGQGKSLLSLSLIDRGGKLVSDDVTLVYQVPATNQLYGFAPELLQDHIHIKGLPVINLRKTIGESTLCSHHIIDLVVELSSYSNQQPISPFEFESIFINGIGVDRYFLPKNDTNTLALCIELIIKDRKTRESGYNSAQEFIKRHKSLLS